MKLSYEQILERINSHLSKSGKNYYSDFYIGISKDAQHRLFNEHHVDKDHSWWIFCTAVSNQVASEVEKHYIDLGMRGGTGGGDGLSDMVYCYSVTPTTTE